MQARSRAEATPLSIVFGGKAPWPLPRPVPAVPTTAPSPETLGPEEEPLLRELGATLRRRRTQRGLSLERLSAISGVSRSMLSRVERGESAPTIFTLVRIARAVHVDLATLLPQAILHPSPQV